MLKNYLKTAFRNLWTNRTYSFLNIFGLAVGIVCAGFIFLWVENEFTYDHHHEKRNQLYQVLEHQAYEGKKYTFSSTPGILAEAMKAEIPGVKNTFRMTWSNYTLFSVGEKAIYERGHYVDSSIFDVFTLPFVQGRKEDAFKQLHSVVITESMAKRFFGNDNNVIGKTINVDKVESYIVSGVIKDQPENSTFRFDWLIPFKIYHDLNRWLDHWGNNGIQTFAELEEKADPDEVNKKLYGFISSKDTTAIAKPFLLTMNDWRLRNKFEEGVQSGGRIQFVSLFTIIAWIILLIACINFMNLATARSEKRAREVGVRKVLGAGKRTLVLQFIGESLFMSFLSLFLAIGIMQMLLPAFNLLVEQKLSLGLGSPSHISALLLIGLVCGLVAGSYPALYLSSFNPIWVFKGLRLKTGGAALIRKGLVVLQFTISIVLIISTIIIFFQIQHVKSRDLGYSKDRLVQTGVRGDMQKNYSVIKNEMLASGMVETVALSNLNMIYMGSQTTDYNWEGKDENNDVLITEDYITPEYIKTLGVRMKYGRDFHPIAENDSMSLIINETLAKFIGKENPVGMILRRDTVSYTVVGVVKDFVFEDMYGKADPLIFVVRPHQYGYMYIKLAQSANTEDALAKIESIVKANNPGYPFNSIFVDDEFERRFKSESLIAMLSRVFALLAILITCLGLFGLAAYTAERRKKEIGIRKVLGASVSGITQLLSKDFLKLVLISAIIAFPIAWWGMHSFLQNFAYRISIQWWVFLVAGLAAFLIATLTISFQSIRAAIASPVNNLRTE